MKKKMIKSNITIDEEKVKMLKELAEKTMLKINNKVRNNLYDFNNGVESLELSNDILRYGVMLQHIMLYGELP